MSDDTVPRWLAWEIRHEDGQNTYLGSLLSNKEVTDRQWPCVKDPATNSDMEMFSYFPRPRMAAPENIYNS